MGLREICQRLHAWREARRRSTLLRGAQRKRDTERELLALGYSRRKAKQAARERHG